MFLLYLFKNPLYYVSVAVIVTASVWLQKRAQSRAFGQPLVSGLFKRPFFLVLLMIGVSWVPLPPVARTLKIAFAGPLTNAVLLLVFSLAATLLGVLTGIQGNPVPAAVTDPLLSLLQLVAFVNTLLLVVNLLPLPPLDGEILWKARYAAVERLSEWWKTAVEARLGGWALVLLLALLDPLLRLLAVLLMSLPVLLWGWLFP